jgi:hypothetical protein
VTWSEARATRLTPLADRRLASMAADDGGVSGRQRLAPEHALPKHLTSFIGRERELATVRRLLADSRMRTVVGSGGVGKTRLAVSVADGWSLDGEQVVDIVAFMDLASLLDPDLAPETLAARLGSAKQPGRGVVATLVDAVQSACRCST